jgi:hypothetical protein
MEHEDIRAVGTVTVDTSGQFEIRGKCSSGWIPPSDLTHMTISEFEGFIGLAPQYMKWVRACADGISAEKYSGLLAQREQAVRSELGGVAAAAVARADSLRGQLADAEAAKGRVEKNVRENMESMFRTLGAEKDKMIAYLKEEIGRREEKIRDLEVAASARLKVQQNAALRGRAGEDSFESMAGCVGWRVERTAGESHMCDFKGVVCGLDVFFEIKNHADVIPSKELAKFRRDMAEHPEIGAGVFIGMQAPCVRGERWSLEWTADRRPMIFIGELEKDDPVSVLRIVEKFLGVVAGMRRDADDDDKGEVVAVLEQRIKTASSYLESVGGKLRGLYNKIVVDKGAADAAYNSSLLMLKTIREEHIVTVDALLGTLKFEVDVGGDVGASMVIVGGDGVTTSSSSSPKKKRTAAPRKAAAAAAAASTESILVIE